MAQHQLAETATEMAAPSVAEAPSVAKARELERRLSTLKHGASLPGAVKFKQQGATEAQMEQRLLVDAVPAEGDDEAAKAARAKELAKSLEALFSVHAVAWHVLASWGHEGAVEAGFSLPKEGAHIYGLPRKCDMIDFLAAKGTPLLHMDCVKELAVEWHRREVLGLPPRRWWLCVRIWRRTRLRFAHCKPGLRRLERGWRR